MNENHREITKLPAHIKQLAQECDVYFKGVIGAVTAFAKDAGIKTPIPQTFFLARARNEDGYTSATKEQCTRWDLYWVAVLDKGPGWDARGVERNRPLDEGDQWQWITCSHWHGDATNAIVFHADITFNAHKQPFQKFSTWEVCTSVPSKDRRVHYSTCTHLTTLSGYDFEELCSRVLKTIRENHERAHAFRFFNMVPAEPKQ